MELNIALSPAENFANLMNDANPGLGMDVTKFTLGAVSPRVPDADTNNSEIVINAIPNQGFSGSVTITYNRLALTEGVVSVPSAISINPEDDLDTRISKVLAGLNLAPQHVQLLVGGELVGESNPIPTPANEDDDSVVVTVRALPSSTFYVGDDLDIMITVPDADVPLGTAVANTQMSGFDAAS